MVNKMQQVLHYPRLDTVLNVEKVIKNAKEPLSKNEIDRRLRKKIMRATLNLILRYLEESGKVALLKGGTIWIYKGDISERLRTRLTKGIHINEEVEKIKPKILKVLKRNDVVKAGIFGSYARGKVKKGSDIDILIKFRGRKSLFDLVRVERELKKILNKDVDLLTYNSISPLLKEKILKEEVRII